MNFVGLFTEEQDQCCGNDSADCNAKQEQQQIIGCTQNANDGATVRNHIGDAEHACQCAGHAGTNDDAGQDMLRIRRGKRNCAFGDANQTHEECGQAGTLFFFIEQVTSKEGCQTDSQLRNRDGSCNSTHKT